MKGNIMGAEARPLICTPLIGKTTEAILLELTEVLTKKPDIIEWRADFFDGIASTDQIIGVARQIQQTAGDTPIIFTIRSFQEGGQKIPLSDEQIIEVNAAVCRETAVEYVDCELRNSPEQIGYLRDIATQNHTGIIMSYHNFDHTPAKAALLAKLVEAEKSGADVAKIAVMPHNLDDVLILLQVTLDAKNSLKIPVITMSMGEYGALTRMVGGVFGSTVTFAVGQGSSAPGQIPIEDLRRVLEIVERAMGIRLER